MHQTEMQLIKVFTLRSDQNWKLSLMPEVSF